MQSEEPGHAVSRRAVFGAAGLLVLAGCSSSGSGSPASTGPSTGSGHTGGVTPEKITYGSDPSQFGELSRPAAATHPGVVVIVHGGFWRAQYGLSLGRPLAADLVARGYTCWNLEYRRVGDGGGWPATLDDVAAGIDHLATLGFGSAPVVVVGHSAGGQLGVWAAGRGKLGKGSPGAGPKVTPVGVVSQAGVLDMVTAANTGVGGTAEADLLGGTPAKVPDRYRVADPIQAVPIAAPVLCVHAKGDQNVPYAQSTAYVAAATEAGGTARLHEVAGDHFTLIDPTSAAWAVVVDALPDLFAGHLPS